MLIVVGGVFVLGFVLGMTYANTVHNIKKRNRYERRNKIIQRQQDIVNEMCRLELEHPELLQISEHKGVTIFKGGANLMTNKEFQNALRNFGKAIKSTAQNVKDSIRIW